jgi:hypothetical protein
MGTFIYALVDPRNNRIRYIGKAIDIYKRLSQHLREKSDTRKGRWIKSLLASGHKPTLVILEEVEGNWEDAERKWIFLFRESGAELCNHTDGGEGCRGMDAQSRKKLSDFRKSYSLANRDRILEIARSPERRKKISDSHKGKEKSKEHLAKISQSQKGRKLTQEQKDKISRSLMGNKYAAGTKRSEEQKKYISARLKGKKHPKRKHSEESNLKRSITLKGRAKSKEWKEKLREGALRRWKRVKEEKEKLNALRENAKSEKHSPE